MQGYRSSVEKEPSWLPPRLVAINGIIVNSLAEIPFAETVPVKPPLPTTKQGFWNWVIEGLAEMGAAHYATYYPGLFGQDDRENTPSQDD